MNISRLIQSFTLGFSLLIILTACGGSATTEVSEGDIVFMAWQHGRYFFSVDSLGSGEALDRFMQAFPY